MTTTAHLALPPFWMHAEELHTLAPGDVVLCGVGELASAAGCAVVTPTLWRLCNASVTELAATRMVASCEAWHPTPIECGPEGRARGVCSALVLTGRAGPASLRSLGECIAQGRLEFANDPAGAQLAVDGTITARGEIVRCEGEIGLRVLEMIDNAEGGPSC